MTAAYALAFVRLRMVMCVRVGRTTRIASTCARPCNPLPNTTSRDASALRVHITIKYFNDRTNTEAAEAERRI